MLNVLDLFSGIGGFSLGLERAGFRTSAFCEIDPFCRQVLAKHWPDVPIHDDIQQLDSTQYAGTVDVVCGGFPCQDISVGHTWREAKGLDGERSGLWREYARIILEVKPRWVVIENVAALRTRGLGRVLQDLDSLGYVGEWHVISAAAVGAEHLRERVWIIAHTASIGMEGLWPEGIEVALPLVEPLLPLRGCDGEWEVEPDIRRADDGLPNRVDRLRAIGNAVVPQISELIGRTILAYEQQLGLAA